MTKIGIKDLLNNNLKKWGNRNFIYTKVNNEFVPKTFEKTINDTFSLAAYLLHIGLEKKHILIYGENSYEWIISDLASMYVGVAVSANKEWREKDLENIIKIADVECIIYSNNNETVVNNIKEKFNIKCISMQNDLPKLIEEGSKLLEKKSEKFKEKNREEMCKIVFTSGTTSNSKAVMLSEKNLFAGFESLSKRAPMGTSDKIYLFLPLNHTYSGIYNLLAALYFGMELYLCSDTNKIIEELQIVKPTIFCAVPLIYERIYSMLGETVIKEVQINKNKKYLKQVKDIFGGDIKYLFCGGAKYSSDIRKFYKDAELKMLEAYALTETASSLSIEYADSKNVSSVGTIFEDIDVKFIDIDENGYGEILVKGDNVALGYYKNEIETKKAFDTDGYFHTGDIGYKDSKNQLFLMGRKRRMIVFSNGENIYPDEIEDLFANIEGINKVKVFENSNKILATIFVKNNEIDVEKIVNAINESLPKYKRITSYDIVIDSIDKRMK